MLAAPPAVRAADRLLQRDSKPAEAATSAAERKPFLGNGMRAPNGLSTRRLSSDYSRFYCVYIGGRSRLACGTLSSVHWESRTFVGGMPLGMGSAMAGKCGHRPCRCVITGE